MIAGQPYQIMPEMTPEQYDELKEDIRRRGVLQPIEYDTDGNIIDGHHRFQAFAELIEEGADLPMFDKTVRRFASEQEKIDYVIALNVKRRHITPEQRRELAVKLRKPPFNYTIPRIAELLGKGVGTIWRDLDDADDETKKELAQLEHVSSDGRSMPATYAPRVFIPSELTLRNAQTNAVAEAVADARTDKLDELLEKWQVTRGQVWLVPSKTLEDRAHRLMCGSILSNDDAHALMYGALAQLAVTSPPYNQGLDKFSASGMQRENERQHFTQRMSQAYEDSLPEDMYQQQQRDMMTRVARFSTPNASFFYNHKHRYRDKETISPYAWITHDTGWFVRQEIIWDRGSSITLNARMFIPAEERIYWLFKGDDFYFADTVEVKAWTNIWSIPARPESDVSAAFPNAIPERAIRACSERGDIVLEPYGGSGTTLVEAERHARICYAMEINPKYVAATLQRCADMGLEPELQK